MTTLPDSESYPVDAVYKVEGYDGVAWRVDEFIEQNMVRCHMIGDDRSFEFDIEELTKIEEGTFCWSCGQIGCGWH